jgi:hypothetical protein
MYKHEGERRVKKATGSRSLGVLCARTPQHAKKNAHAGPPSHAKGPVPALDLWLVAAGGK